MWCICLSRRKDSLVDDCAMKDHNNFILASGKKSCNSTSNPSRNDMAKSLEKDIKDVKLQSKDNSGVNSPLCQERTLKPLRIETGTSPYNSGPQSPTYSRENSVKLKILRTKTQNPEYNNNNKKSFNPDPIDFDEIDEFFFNRNRSSFKIGRNVNYSFAHRTRASSFRHTTKSGSNAFSYNFPNSTLTSKRNNGGYINNHTAPFRRGSMIVRSARPHNSDFHTIPKFPENEMPLGEFRFNTENLIFTPFAQILASLRKVRLMFMKLTKTTSNNPNSFIPNTIFDTEMEDFNPDSEQFKLFAENTLEELEWSLQQLESIQTKRPVSNMASTKFKRLLNRELNNPTNSDKTKQQISDYISKTFLEKESDDDEDERRSVQSKYSYTSKCSNESETIQSESIISLQKSNQTSSSSNDPCYLSIMDMNNSEKLDEFFENYLDFWGMDVFDLAMLTNGHPLTTITYKVFQKRNIFFKLNLESKTVINYLLKLESSYDCNVPYHNSTHAADVVQSTHVLLQAENLEGVFTDLETFALLFACAVHDVSHPGVTNQFLVNTNHELAICYNDVSVLENFHLTVAFKLLNNTDCDLFQRLLTKQRQTLRRIVIDLVLATDMSKHMNLLADLKTMVETKKVAGSGILNLDNYTDRIQILQNMIHCADLSNPTKPWMIYEGWTSRIMEEFFQQGDKERALNLEISPMCDRNSVAIVKSQISFIDFIVLPLWETWCDLVHPSNNNILDLLEENREVYQARFNESVSEETKND